MATFTLTANSDYSAIKGSLANDDTIDCDGFRLTVDEQPALTGIAVTSPGTAGTMTVNDAYDMSTWSITAGTVQMIGTFPSGATLGSATGGSVNNSHAIGTNNGTVITATAGNSASRGVNTNNGTITNANASGAITGTAVLTNNGTITNATGGAGSTSFGCQTNNGTVTNATGGQAGSAAGVSANNGTVTNATGGSGANANGVTTNTGTVLSATGGSNATAYGVATNLAIVFAADDATGFGVNNSFSAIKVVDGPNYKSRIITSGTARPVTTVYSIGTLSNLASLDPGITVITVNTGTGPAAKPTLRGGFAN
jgi:fibronectin-binding autotransporter adhesin